MSPRTKAPGAMFSLAVFGVLPLVLLLLIVIASGGAQIVLDHEILGRNAAAVPVLQTLALLRQSRSTPGIWRSSMCCRRRSSPGSPSGARGVARAGAGSLRVPRWSASSGAFTASTDRLDQIKGTSQLVIGIETHIQCAGGCCSDRLALNLAVLVRRLGGSPGAGARRTKPPACPAPSGSRPSSHSCRPCSSPAA